MYVVLNGKNIPKKVLTLNIVGYILVLEARWNMSDVREVFITSEVASKVDITTPYLIRVAKEMNFSESEFREAGKRNYLFSQSAVDKLVSKFRGDKQKETV